MCSFYTLTCSPRLVISLLQTCQTWISTPALHVSNLAIQQLYLLWPRIYAYFRWKWNTGKHFKCHMIYAYYHTLHHRRFLPNLPQFIIHFSFHMSYSLSLNYSKLVKTLYITIIHYITSPFERFSNIRLSKSISLLRLITILGKES